MLRTFPLLSVLVAGVAAQTSVETSVGRVSDSRLESAAVVPKLAAAREGPAARYSVLFEHRLTNRTSRAVSKVRIYVPVPEDCYQQEVRGLRFLRNGSPSRVSFRRDQYGQRFAMFVAKIDPGGSLVVGYRCQATLWRPPKVSLQKIQLADMAKIPEQIRATYTMNVPRVYDTDSEAIRRKAREIARQHDDVTARVKAIYEFVAERLVYKREGGWDSASDVLARGNGSCSEFSYVFSSLCRANGIPTRFVGATMFRKHEVKSYPYVDRVWHRWVQVYLPGPGWVHMDPTRDRGKRARDIHFGRQPGPSLVLSHHGGKSRYLGNHYVSGDNQSSRQVRRSRSFKWTPLPRNPDEARGRAGQGRPGGPRRQR